MSEFNLQAHGVEFYSNESDQPSSFGEHSETDKWNRNAEKRHDGDRSKCESYSITSETEQASSSGNHRSKEKRKHVLSAERHKSTTSKEKTVARRSGGSCKRQNFYKIPQSFTDRHTLQAEWYPTLANADVIFFYVLRWLERYLKNKDLPSDCVLWKNCHTSRPVPQDKSSSSRKRHRSVAHQSRRELEESQDHIHTRLSRDQVRSCLLAENKRQKHHRQTEKEKQCKQDHKNTSQHHCRPQFDEYDSVLMDIEEHANAVLSRPPPKLRPQHGQTTPAPSRDKKYVIGRNYFKLFESSENSETPGQNITRGQNFSHRPVFTGTVYRLFKFDEEKNDHDPECLNSADNFYTRKTDKPSVSRPPPEYPERAQTGNSNNTPIKSITKAANRKLPQCSTTRSDQLSQSELTMSSLITSTISQQSLEIDQFAYTGSSSSNYGRILCDLRPSAKPVFVLRNRKGQARQNESQRASSRSPVMQRHKTSPLDLPVIDDLCFSTPHSSSANRRTPGRDMYTRRDSPKPMKDRCFYKKSASSENICTKPRQKDQQRMGSCDKPKVRRSRYPHRTYISSSFTESEFKRTFTRKFPVYGDSQDSNEYARSVSPENLSTMARQRDLKWKNYGNRSLERHKNYAHRNETSPDFTYYPESERHYGRNVSVQGDSPKSTRDSTYCALSFSSENISNRLEQRDTRRKTNQDKSQVQGSRYLQRNDRHTFFNDSDFERNGRRKPSVGEDFPSSVRGSFQYNRSVSSENCSTRPVQQDEGRRNNYERYQVRGYRHPQRQDTQRNLRSPRQDTQRSLRSPEFERTLGRNIPVHDDSPSPVQDHYRYTRSVSSENVRAKPTQRDIRRKSNYEGTEAYESKYSQKHDLESPAILTSAEFEQKFGKYMAVCDGSPKPDKEPSVHNRSATPENISTKPVQRDRKKCICEKFQALDNKCHQRHDTSRISTNSEYERKPREKTSIRDDSTSPAKDPSQHSRPVSSEAICTKRAPKDQKRKDSCEKSQERDNKYFQNSDKSKMSTNNVCVRKGGKNIPVRDDSPLPTKASSHHSRSASSNDSSTQSKHRKSRRNNSSERSQVRQGRVNQKDDSSQTVSKTSEKEIFTRGDSPKPLKGSSQTCSRAVSTEGMSYKAKRSQSKKKGSQDRSYHEDKSPATKNRTTSPDVRHSSGDQKDNFTSPTKCNSEVVQDDVLPAPAIDASSTTDDMSSKKSDSRSNSQMIQCELPKTNDSSCASQTPSPKPSKGALKKTSSHINQQQNTDNLSLASTSSVSTSSKPLRGVMKKTRSLESSPSTCDKASGSEMGVINERSLNSLATSSVPFTRTENSGLSGKKSPSKQRCVRFDCAPLHNIAEADPEPPLEENQDKSTMVMESALRGNRRRRKKSPTTMCLEDSSLNCSSSSGVQLSSSFTETADERASQSLFHYEKLESDANN